jgi:hypothetical protein
LRPPLGGGALGNGGAFGFLGERNDWDGGTLGSEGGLALASAALFILGCVAGSGGGNGGGVRTVLGDSVGSDGASLLLLGLRGGTGGGVRGRSGTGGGVGVGSSMIALADLRGGNGGGVAGRGGS